MNILKKIFNWLFPRLEVHSTIKYHHKGWGRILYDEYNRVIDRSKKR